MTSRLSARHDSHRGLRSLSIHERRAYDRCRPRHCSPAPSSGEWTSLSLTSLPCYIWTYEITNSGGAIYISTSMRRAYDLRPLSALPSLARSVGQRALQHRHAPIILRPLSSPRRRRRTTSYYLQLLRLHLQESTYIFIFEKHLPSAYPFGPFMPIPTLSHYHYLLRSCYIRISISLSAVACPSTSVAKEKDGAAWMAMLISACLSARPFFTTYQCTRSPAVSPSPPPAHR